MTRSPHLWFVRVAGLIVTRLGIARTSKLAGFGGLTVVLLMAGLAGGAGIRAEERIESARVDVARVLVADKLHRAVSRQEAELEQFGTASGTTTAKFEGAARVARRSIANDAPALTESSALIARMLRVQDRLDAAARAVIRSRQAHHRGEARRLLRERFWPARFALDDLIDAAEKRAVVRVDDQLLGLEEANELVLTAMPVALMVAVLALALMWTVGLEARRREAATQAELELLEGQARTDSLTGAGNHRAFQEDLTQALQGSGDPLSRVSLAMIDLVGLKRVNDTRGHHVGDDRLRLVADCARRLPACQGFYRVGGDEFAVVLIGTGAWDAFEFVQSLHEELLSASAADPVTVTAGIADAPADADKDRLVEHADLALIAAKTSRRETLVYSPDLQRSPETSVSDADRRHAETIATALARAVDAKDSYTRSHSETVSVLCGLIAEELALAPERIAALKLAGLLHDVGKIGISDDILQKPGRLTEEEFEVMKSHSTIGHRIVMGAPLEEEAEWILHHHERPTVPVTPTDCQASSTPSSHGSSSWPTPSRR